MSSDFSQSILEIFDSLEVSSSLVSGAPESKLSLDLATVCTVLVEPGTVPLTGQIMPESSEPKILII